MNEPQKSIKSGLKADASCAETFDFPTGISTRLDQMAKDKGVTTDQLIINCVENMLNQEPKEEIIIDPFEKGFKKQKLSNQISFISIKLDNLTSMITYNELHSDKNPEWFSKNLTFTGKLHDISDMLDEIVIAVSKLEKRRSK